jgi:Leucine-rich repeat (LRR) protein
LPLEITSFTEITSLNLSGNVLGKLPPEIGNLIHLTELQLGWEDEEGFRRYVEALRF